MGIKDRRRNLRYEAELGATIFNSKIKVKASMVDISEGGIGVISENVITPGTKVFISLALEGNYVFHGAVVWSSLIHYDQKNYYRMGIETDSVIQKDIRAISFPDKSELLAQILTQIKNQKLKVVENYSF